MQSKPMLACLSIHATFLAFVRMVPLALRVGSFKNYHSPSSHRALSRSSVQQSVESLAESDTALVELLATLVGRGGCTETKLEGFSDEFLGEDIILMGASRSTIERIDRHSPQLPIA